MCRTLKTKPGSGVEIMIMSMAITTQRKLYTGRNKQQQHALARRPLLHLGRDFNFLCDIVDGRVAPGRRVATFAPCCHPLEQARLATSVAPHQTVPANHVNSMVGVGVRPNSNRAETSQSMEKAESNTNLKCPWQEATGRIEPNEVSAPMTKVTARMAGDSAQRHENRGAPNKRYC